MSWIKTVYRGYGEKRMGRRVVLIPLFWRRRRAYDVMRDAFVDGRWYWVVGLGLERIGARVTHGFSLRVWWGFVPREADAVAAAKAYWGAA